MTTIYPFTIHLGPIEITGYGIMNFLMTATPLAMSAHHHGDTDTAFVFQWHVIAM